MTARERFLPTGHKGQRMAHRERRWADRGDGLLIQGDRPRMKYAAVLPHVLPMLFACFDQRAEAATSVECLRSPPGYDTNRAL